MVRVGRAGTAHQYATNHWHAKVTAAAAAVDRATFGLAAAARARPRRAKRPAPPRAVRA